MRSDQTEPIFRSNRVKNRTESDRIINSDHENRPNRTEKITKPKKKPQHFTTLQKHNKFKSNPKPST